MYRLLILKELKNILLSPKFSATLAVCSILILTSMGIGIQEYNHAVSQYEANQSLARQNMEQANGWGRVTQSLHRKPDIMQVFVAGLHYDVGRLSSINRTRDVKLQRSPYSDETLFAVFRFIDFTFIVQVVLSLFAILFTYNAINGERENGTLKLAFANPVSRIEYLVSKCVGIWLGLVIPLCIPILVGLLIIQLTGLPVSGEDWSRILSFLGLSMLYLTFFVVLGIWISSLTRKSSLSFLLLLVFWIASVLIIPRLGVTAAGQVIPTESIAQIEAKQAAFEKARWQDYTRQLTENMRERADNMTNMTEEERASYQEEKEWDWLEQDDAARKQLQTDITNNNRLLLEETRNKQVIQQALAFNLARVSPASSYRLAAMQLATTDMGMKTRYEEAMRVYRDNFVELVKRKQDETGQTGGFKINIDSNRGMKIDFDRNNQGIDISEVPLFTEPKPTLKASLVSAIPDFGLLGLFILLAFGGSFFAFTRYDMR